MTQPTQEELLEEVQRFIRIVDRDITAFKVLKNVPETHIATVCFHAQQAVEKSIKAVLILHGVELRRTHTKAIGFNAVRYKHHSPGEF